jgi:4-hydroxy-tetrahydrodipicolinate synthase
LLQEEIFMVSKPIFTGAATALITPATPAGVDYEALGRLIDWQIDRGIDALVIAGSTGEGKTLSIAEHKEVLRFSAERIAGRVPMIAGTGSNDTDYAVDLSRFACGVGYDALLVVTPYYNKATQKGLIRMYETIADAATKPLILYNVPSRTGVNIEPATYRARSEHPGIAGVKEANGNLSKIVETFALAGDRLDIYSGNDDQAVPILAMGGEGVISVLSNVLPRQTSLMCRKFFEGDLRGSMAMQKKYLPLINALFSEVNPIPVKAAMARLGWGENFLRLPLTPMEEAHEKILFDLMAGEGLIG